MTANATDDNRGSIGVMARAGMTVSHGPGGLVRGVAMREFWSPPPIHRPDAPSMAD